MRNLVGVHEKGNRTPFLPEMRAVRSQVVSPPKRTARRVRQVQEFPVANKAVTAWNHHPFEPSGTQQGLKLFGEHRNWEEVTRLPKCAWCGGRALFMVVDGEPWNGYYVRCFHCDNKTDEFQSGQEAMKVWSLLTKLQT